MKKLAQLTAFSLVLVAAVGCSEPASPSAPAATAPPAATSAAAPSKLTILIQQPGTPLALRVRLRADLLQAYGIEPDDVLEALKPSGLIAPNQPAPPPGVVYSDVSKPQV